MKVTIDPSERWILLGKTGSGKTEYAKYMLRIIQQKMPVVIVDPKEFWLGKHPIWETRKKNPGNIDKPHLVDKFNPKLWVQCYQPDEEDGIEELNQFCFQVLKFGNRFIYFDETEGIATAHTVPAGIRKLWKTGRSKGIGAWASTQVPTGIPKIFKSQAEKFVVFKVGAEDVDLAASIGHALKEEVAALGKYEYLFYDSGSMDRAIHQMPVPYKEKIPV